MEYNKIPVTFRTRRRASTEEINYRYDIKQVLVIDGIDELPEYFRVDFCNEGDSSTKPMIGTAAGVDIPDEYLLTGKPIKAYIVLSGTEGDTETRYEIDIPVRFRPPDTEEVPTPEQQDIIDQLIAALNAGVEAAEDSAGDAAGSAEDAAGSAGEAEASAAKAEEAVSHYPKLVHAYWWVWDAENERWVDTGINAEGDGTGIDRIEKTGTSGLVDTYTIYYTDETTSTFTVTNGKDGKDGEDGDDGFSPVVTVTQITGGHRISIQDKTQIQAFDVMDGSDGFSPVVTITTITGGHRISIQDKTQTQIFDIMDGTNGVSPAVTITQITGGHRVTITDASHPNGQSFDVMDGEVSLQDLAAALAPLESDIDELDVRSLLTIEEIPDTVQTYTFTSGNLTQLLHSRNNTAVRTDAFTYGTNTLTEVRTLSSGESLTIVTNLTTLETTITYSDGGGN